MKDDIISKEQLYKMLHISKRKAAYLLEQKIIPCKILNRDTHRYFIRLSDVETYIRITLENPDAYDIPIGIFNASPTKIHISLELCLTLNESERQEMIEFLDERFADAPDILLVCQVTVLIGYTQSCLNDRIQNGDIPAAKIMERYLVLKLGLIEFIASQKAFDIRRKSTKHCELIREFMKQQKQTCRK